MKTFIEALKLVWKQIWKFIANWHEFISLPLGLLLWVYSEPLLKLLDKTSAPIDAGIFQIVIYIIIAFLILHAIAWILLRLTFPKVYKFLDDTLEDLLTGDAVTDWQKAKIVLWLFTLYIGGLVLLAMRIVG